LQTNYDIDTLDWEGDYSYSRNTFSSVIASKPSSSASWVCLAHDIQDKTVHGLAQFMIDQARKRGYKLTTYGDCVGDPMANWYRDPVTGGPHNPDSFKGGKGTDPTTSPSTSSSASTAASSTVSSTSSSSSKNPSTTPKPVNNPHFGAGTKNNTAASSPLPAPTAVQTTNAAPAPEPTPTNANVVKGNVAGTLANPLVVLAAALALLLLVN